MNKWDELKEWITEKSEKRAYDAMHLIYQSVLDKMRVIEDREYCKSLTEAGY